MREIKFRGLNYDEWHYGYYCWEDSVHYILERYDHDRGWGVSYEEVDPETVGQFTGLKDKNGKEIYEGDIVRVKNWRYGIYEIQWHNGAWTVFTDNKYERIGQNLAGDCFEVIGNKFENPELLEQ